MMAEHSGIGMTSQRTRDRLADTLVEMGIKSERGIGCDTTNTTTSFCR